MLQSLSIRNFAIIDRLDVEFGPGLNVLTGETGAGKSILMGALTVILGGRAGAEMVRGQADKASIDAVFDISRSPELQNAVISQGLELEDGLLYLSREISAAGKSTARVSGRPAAVAQLKEMGDWLADLHGQHEHQSLFAVQRHIDILDEWGGSETVALRERAGETFRTLRGLEQELSTLEADTRERARLLDLYTFQVQEINDAGLNPGEEEELKGDSRRLANAQRLAEAAESAESAIQAENASVLETLAAVSRSVDEAAVLDELLAPIAESVNSARFTLEEAARDLRKYCESIEFNPERLQQIEERLDLISNLKRKYGDTVDDIIHYGRRTADQLDALSHSEERGVELNGEIATTRLKLTEMCGELTEQRTRLASQFSTTVESELQDLAMEKTRFEAHIEPKEPDASGADKVEFLIAPNPGEPLRSLARIASGGEISRVMLAIKSAMSRQDPLPTMVFDEIDAGVGGRTASVLAEKLSLLAQSAQIICITHLPQIASRAASHYYIEKRVSEGRTVTDVTPLSKDERVDELARMLGGKQVTETALKHAREMLNVS
jgi:DNA repair protein RecN (Recombination protein N)